MPLRHIFVHGEDLRALTDFDVDGWSTRLLRNRQAVGSTTRPEIVEPDLRRQLSAGM